jgi:hypothetical protein
VPAIADDALDTQRGAAATLSAAKQDSPVFAKLALR